MRRGDLVSVALNGDFGKPRPALIIQSDQFAESETVTVLLMSSAVVEAPLIRLTVAPDARNGRRTASQIMIDKAMTVRRGKIGSTFGHLDDDAMTAVNRSLSVFIGLA